jgi:methionyl-tRNA formyltransferase
MRFLWLSANFFGYRLLQEAITVPAIQVQGILTLKRNARTRMYDGIEPGKWHEFGLPVHEIDEIHQEVSLVERYTPDFLVVCGWRQILPRQILQIPRRGVIGFHPTLLPRGRGPAPIINSILEGISSSGVSLFYVSDQLDAGDIIGQEPFTIETSDEAGDVYAKVIDAGCRLVRRYFPLLADDCAPRFPQDFREATYFPRRTLDDNEIHLERDGPEMAMRKIRAFARPYLGAFIRTGGKRLVIWKGEIRDDHEPA